MTTVTLAKNESQTRARAEERRRSPRTRVEAPGQLLPCSASGKTKALEVTVCDVSATGVGVVCDNELPLGQQYVVKEPSVARQPSALYTVVRADPLANGQYSVGLHATRLISPDSEAAKTARLRQRQHIINAIVWALIMIGAVGMILAMMN